MSRAERESKDEKLRRYPWVSRNASKLADAVRVLLQMRSTSTRTWGSAWCGHDREEVAGGKLFAAARCRR